MTCECKGSEEGDRRCVQCQQSKPLTAFSQYKGKTAACRTICQDCMWSAQQARRHRLARQRELWQHPGEWEQRKQQAWERSIGTRRVYEQRQREREDWLRQQPERCCRACRRLLPASAFGIISSACGFALQTRCSSCHARAYEGRQPVCCLCGQSGPHCELLTYYQGYALCGDGSWISLCCRNCELAFCALSDEQQAHYIHAACQKSFPAGQVIYGEVDPETQEIRYVGRTSHPRRRHAQHLADTSPTTVYWGTERKVWYTRGNWMHMLLQRGLTPRMQILRSIDVSPLVVEWEQRSIWHGIQQGWELLNSEAMDDGLVARVKAARLDFLQAPFEVLVQQQFFSSHGLVAFLHRWCASSKW